MAIRRERVSWIMAFRYDQAVRTSVMTFRNSNGKLANPAIRDEKIEREARNETERLGDFQPRFADINPYSEGHPKLNINPITGDINPIRHQNSYTVPSSTFNHSTQYAKPNALSWAYANTQTHQPFYDGPGSSGYQSYEDRRGGGRNVRGRGRGGGWTSGGGNGRDFDRTSGNRDNDQFENRRSEGSGSLSFPKT